MGTAKEREATLQILRARFGKHPQRHHGIVWDEVQARLKSQKGALVTVEAMELSGGEPDVIGTDEAGRFLICDCSAETPTKRRSLCYDDEALAARKEHRPVGSAVATATDLGIELLDEAQYRFLQSLGDFDTKTSSWLRTPPGIRALGGALFGDRRYGQVFVYHNGAQSYYAVRGFRGLFRL